MQNTQTPTASQLIRAAIAAAGRGPAVTKALGVKAPGLSKWTKAGRIPARYIKPLCDLGGNVVTPTQILEALTREAGDKATA